MLSKQFSIGLIIIAGAVLGVESLQGSWHFDDYYSIVRNEALRSPSSIVRAVYDPALFSADPERPMYRPTLVASYTLNYLFFGDHVRGFLLVNLLLHILNALLVWAIAGRLLGEGGNMGALAAGLIYVVHPAATEGIAYVSARSAVLATTFTLAAFYSYIRWFARQKAVSLLLSAALFVLALGAKSIAITLPAMLVIYHLWFPPGGERELKKAAVGLVTFSIIAAGYVVLRRVIMGVVLAESQVRPIKDNLLTQSRAYMHYLRLYLWPLHQSINPYFRTSDDFFEPAALMSVAGITIMVAISLALWRRSSRNGKVFSFGMLWLLIAFLPESSIVPLNLVVSERRMVLPLVGYSLIMGAAVGIWEIRGHKSVVLTLEKLKKQVLCPQIFPALLVVCLASLSLVRLREWRGELSLWRSATRVDPNWGLLWNNLGLIRLESGDKLAAMGMFELASRHDPKFKEAYLNLGNLYFQSGQYEEAEGFYLKALKIDGGYEKAAVYLAQLWERAGRRKDAVDFLERYATERPGARVYYMLGIFAEEDGDPERAARWHRQAIKQRPAYPPPHLALGTLLLKTGDSGEAAYHLKRFLELTGPGEPNREEAVRLLKEIE